MTVHVNWDDPNCTVIRLDFIQRWSWDDFQYMLREAHEMIRSMSYPVHLIINTLESAGFPKGSPFPHLNSMLNQHPTDTGLIIIVTRKTFFKMVIATAVRFYGNREHVRIVSTLDEAQDMTISQHSETRLKQGLVRQMASNNHDLALQAVEELRSQNWLYDGTIQNVGLDMADLHSADLFMANLEDSRLIMTNLHDANLFMANLRNANLYQATLTNANLLEANLQNANLSLANLQGVNLTSAALQGADLRFANLSEAILHGANLTEANLGRTVLRGARLSSVNMKKANLEEANLQGAMLEFARIDAANLRAVDLQQADLRNARLEKTVLLNANLEGANLSAANFAFANLSGANLKNAVLNHTDLRGAILHGAELDLAALERAELDENTILPDGSHWSVGCDLESFSDPANDHYWKLDETKPHAPEGLRAGNLDFKTL